jgi:hypothetical protein
MPTQPGYVAVNMVPESREEIRRLMFRLSSAMGHRVSISDTVAVACKVALANFETALGELTSE